jgi:hypothetical protein
LLRFIFVSASHQDLQASELEFGQGELGHVDYQDGFAAFEAGLDVGFVVDYTLDGDFEFFGAEFILDLGSCAQFVSVVDVDEVGFNVVRDGLVVSGFPEAGLPAGTEGVSALG